jgi:hypothetical protein
MTFGHLVKAANAASFGWQLSGSRGYMAAQVPALIEAPVPVFGGTRYPVGWCPELSRTLAETDGRDW